jgi:hypothetical protein
LDADDIYEQTLRALVEGSAKKSTRRSAERVAG